AAHGAGRVARASDVGRGHLVPELSDGIRHVVRQVAECVAPAPATEQRALPHLCHTILPARASGGEVKRAPCAVEAVAGSKQLAAADLLDCSSYAGNGSD